MRRILRDCGGFSLVEMLVSIGILTLVMGMVGTAIFQGLKTDKGVIDDGTAINELRKGLSWLAGDVKMAQTSTLVALDPAVGTVTFTWTDQFQSAGTFHTSTYAVVGNELIRTYDTNSHAVARDVVSAQFSLNGRTVLAEFEVNAGTGATRTLSTKTFMRSAPP